MVFEKMARLPLEGRFYTVHERIDMSSALSGSHRRHILEALINNTSWPVCMCELVIAYCQYAIIDNAIVSSTLASSVSASVSASSAIFSLSWSQLAVVELDSKQDFHQLLWNLHFTELIPELALVLVNRV